MINITESEKRLLRNAKGPMIGAVIIGIAARNHISKEQAAYELEEYLRPKIHTPKVLEQMHKRGEIVEPPKMPPRILVHMPFVEKPDPDRFVDEPPANPEDLYGGPLIHNLADLHPGVNIITDETESDTIPPPKLVPVSNTDKDSNTSLDKDPASTLETTPDKDPDTKETKKAVSKKHK